MFNRLTNLIAQAADVLVGQQSKEDEFENHWKAITRLISESDDKDTTDSCITDINNCLERMADLLFKEEEDNSNSMGPCMEFLIRHKLLDTLCATGKSDYPAGMRKVVFKFFSLILGRIQQPLIPHIAVHRSLNNLIRTCGLSFSNPLAVEEVQFLRALSLTLHNDSTLCNFFIEQKKDGNSQDIFNVAEALMRITNSEDHLVCLKAFECLLLCVSLQTTSNILANSQFPLLLVTKMCQHLQLLSPSLHYTDILRTKGGWGVNYASSKAIHSLSPSPHQPLLHLEAYLSWLDYCEQTINASPHVLQDAICKCIKEHLLENILLPKLSLASETDLIVSFTLLTQSLKSTSHERLRAEFIEFILTNIMDQLTLSCNHLNEEVCISSLLLLHVILRSSFLPRIFSVSEYKQQIVSKRVLDDTAKSYLTIVSSDLLSANEVGGDSGLVYYLLEGHQQVFECRQLVTEWNEETLPASTKGQTILMDGLLDRLERLLDQSYELNLHLTSVLALLAGYPHFDWLFKVSSDDDSINRNVYSVLLKVSQRLKSHGERSPGLQLNIMEARRRLLGEETSDLLSMPNNELLEGAVVLEEFCKEIAAVLYSRYSLQLISSQQ